jgi:hypothetical protein
MSAFHTGIHQRYVMKVDPAAALLRGQHTEQNTIAEYMTLAALWSEAHLRCVALRRVALLKNSLLGRTRFILRLPPY